MTTKKVKVKVMKKKKKLNTKKFLITIILVLLLSLTFVDIINLPVKNIYIKGNSTLSDKTIISLSHLENYPPHIKTCFLDIKEKLLANEYIKDVKIKRTITRKIYIEIEEYKPLAIYNNKLILSSKKQIDNLYNINYVPYITNNIDNIYDKFVTSLNEVNQEILLKISHIEYTPNEVDKERFLMYMVDSNYVYITLSKIEKINKYNSIVKKLENKKGIIYLDSGDYVEIKGWHNKTLII